VTATSPYPEPNASGPILPTIFRNIKSSLLKIIVLNVDVNPLIFLYMFQERTVPSLVKLLTHWNLAVTQT
jgi:hypothetical protein